MYIATNKFGTKTMCTPSDILTDGVKIYIFNCACLTIHTETLGWANHFSEYITTDINAADIIIVLGCQVTDLAILNDINTIDKLKRLHPQKRFFIGGCLAQRFDLFDDKYTRMDILYQDYQPIVNENLITWQEPFWDEIGDDFLRPNNHTHNLRVGKGCHGKCQYCTIRVTRKNYSELNIDELIPEIYKNWNKTIIPTADTLSPRQIETFFEIAQQKRIKFSLRNIEPDNAIRCKETLINFAKSGLLDTIHIPVQSNNIGVLRAMNRSISATEEAIELAIELKKLRVRIATNVIIDYQGETDDYSGIYDIFDHVAWNPYWDGVFALEKARARMKKYIPGYKIRVA